MKTLTTTEAAAALSITLRAVQKHIERGMLAAERRGRDLFISEDEIERFQRERRGRGRPARKERTMIAVEVILENGTFYVPLQEFGRGTVLLPMDNGQRVLTPAAMRANWDGWVADLVDDDNLLTAEELAAQYPGIAIDRER